MYQSKFSSALRIYLVAGRSLWLLTTGMGLLLGSGSGQAASLEANPSPPALTLDSPLALDDRSKAWARGAIDPDSPPHHRFDQLLAALRAPALGLEEHISPTLSAAQALHQRQINCVSFAFLTVALARHLEVPTYFVLIPETLASQPGSSLRVDQQHLAVALAADGRSRLVDFAGDLDPAAFATQPISDLTAIALYHSNRGVEALTAGRLDDAVAALDWATTLDATIPVVWVNLGVALRRLGQTAAAEGAYATALALDPSIPAAQINLENLLISQGQADRAAQMLAATRRAGDPFSVLELAERSLRRGDLIAARAHYLRALELSR